MAPTEVSAKLFQAVGANPEISRQVDSLSQSPGGKSFLERMKNRGEVRIPPPNLLNAVLYGPPHYPGSGDNTAAQKMLQDVAKQAGSLVGNSGAQPREGEPWIIHGQANQVPAAAQNSYQGPVTATYEARLAAQTLKIDLSKVRGTGNFGRVTADDVNKFASGGIASTVPVAPPQPQQRSSGPTPSGGEYRALTPMQAAIARNMADTVQVPVFRVTRSIDVKNLWALFNELKAKQAAVPWSALVAKAAALVLAAPDVRIINARYDPSNKSIFQPATVNIAMAAAGADDALFTPVIRDAATKPLATVAGDWRDLMEKVRAKTLRPADQKDATFYISNLGHLGVDQFDAILPKDAGGILSVGAVKSVFEPAMTANGVVEMHKRMNVTLTCDHRHINGVHAAAFLNKFADLVEGNVRSLLV